MSYLDVKQAALIEFAEKGYDATALKDIAQRVGIKTPSIYFYCSGKEELFIDVFKMIQRDAENFFTDIFAKIISDEEYDEVEMLRDFFLMNFRYFKDDYSKFLFIRRILHHPPVSIDKEKLRSDSIGNSQHLINLFSKVFQRAKSKGIFIKMADIEIFYMMNALIAGYLNQISEYEIMFSEEELGRAFDVFIRGLKA